MNKYLTRLQQILALLLLAIIVVGTSPSANAHTMLGQSVTSAVSTSFEMQAGLSENKTHNGIVDLVTNVKIAAESNSIVHFQYSKNEKPMSGNCNKSCGEACPSTSCMTIILNRDVFNLRQSSLTGRLPVSSINSNYVVQTHPLIQPPKI